MSGKQVAQEIVNDILFKVKHVKIMNRPFTVKIVFATGKDITLTGDLAQQIIKAERELCGS